MIAVREIGERELASPLGRTSPIVKLAVGASWLLGLTFTTDPRPPLALAFLAVVATLVIGRVPPRRLAVGLLPLLAAAAGIALANALFGAANADPAARSLLAIGPIRVTEPAARAAAGLGARVLAIVAVGAAFSLTTDSTRLVDSLVRQLHVPVRFGYGALAAYQAVPRLAEDLVTLRQARRIRGLPSNWHPRILVGLLVRAIRHGDALALAMDARGLGDGPRTWYRDLRWSSVDALVAAGGALALVVALALAR